MNVFSDFHHGSLLQSFILLFEKRLGGRVFRPIGLEWFENGFWKINDQRDTAEQFLGLHAIPADGTPPLNEEIDSIFGVYMMRDTDSGSFNRAITMDAFFAMPFDVVIASIPSHIEPFKKLCQMHPSRPKLIYQIGNAWNIPDNSVANVMASAVIPNVPEGINLVQYHQEFDTQIFYATNPVLLERTDGVEIPGTVYSFINILQNHRDWPTFLECEKILAGWEFRSFGGQCRDGNMTGSQALANKMREARFVWHTKQGGDGYGHILHNAFAVGRPVITRLSDYSGKLGEKLLIPDKTCIAIDDLTPSQIVDKIREFSSPENYSIMCRTVYDVFQSVVDFDQEEIEIREFLNKLK